MMDNGLFVILIISMFLAGLVIGFSVGVDSGFEKCQQQAVAVGAGKLMLAEGGKTKFEWISKTPEKTDKP
jgi:hypothetical protein